VTLHTYQCDTTRTYVVMGCACILVFQHIIHTHSFKWITTSKGVLLSIGDNTRLEDLSQHHAWCFLVSFQEYDFVYYILLFCSPGETKGGNKGLEMAGAGQQWVAWFGWNKARKTGKYGSPNVTLFVNAAFMEDRVNPALTQMHIYGSPSVWKPKCTTFYINALMQH
jgi:hypothetical protein